MKLASNVVLTNNQNADFLPRSVEQLIKLAKLRETDLKEIVEDVQARFSNGEDINTDSPNLWATYREKYGTKGVPKKVPKTAASQPLAAQFSVALGQEGEVTSFSESAVETQPGQAAYDNQSPTLGDHEEVAEDKVEGIAVSQDRATPTLDTVYQQAANDDGKVVALPPNVPETLDPSSLNPEEWHQAKLLFDLWDTTLENQWQSSLQEVRLFFLKWKLKEEEGEATSERQAA